MQIDDENLVKKLGSKSTVCYKITEAEKKEIDICSQHHPILSNFWRVNLALAMCMISSRCAGGEVLPMYPEMK
jgi:hypothetical protein